MRRSAKLFARHPSGAHRIGGAVEATDLGEADVMDVVFQGGFKRVTGLSRRDGATRFVARIPARQPVAAGDRVQLSCAAAEIIVLRG